MSSADSVVSVSQKEPRWYRYSKGIVAGTCAGTTITLIGHPFDTLKVRLQVQCGVNKVYNGLIDCFIKTLKWEGFSGLYKGIASPLAGQLFMRTALFTSYYESLDALNFLNNRDYLYGKFFMAGIAAGFASAFVDTPLDLTKSKLQIQIIQQKSGKPLESEYRNVFHCGKSILNKYGIRGLYQGLGPTIIRNSVGYGLYFGTFEILKNILLREGQNMQDIEPSKIILAGGIAGMVFWTTVYNVDVVKSAMMADHIKKKERIYANMFDCFKKLYTNEGGYSRLWRGFAPCFLRSAPGNAAMLYVVDLTRSLLPSYKSFLELY